MELKKMREMTEVELNSELAKMKKLRERSLALRRSSEKKSLQKPRPNGKEDVI